MIVFAWPVQHQRVTLRSAVALAVGLGGVIILVGGGTASGRISGMIIVLGAAAALGFGSVLSHRLAVPSHAMLAAAIEMLAGGVVLLAVGVGSGELSRIHWSSVPATSWIALAYLIGPGSILAFTAYGYALSHLPVTTVSTYAYVNPVVAVLAGIMFLGEQFSCAKDSPLPSSSSRSSLPCTDLTAHHTRPPFVMARCRKRRCLR
jgi:drug/metabolite transporter (DMT)-like permease